jgi:hypothetical protein
MTLPVVPKSNATPGFVPLPSDIRVGELALNTADSVLYCKNASGEIVPLTSSVTTTNWGSIDAGEYFGVVASAAPFNVTAVCYGEASSRKYLVTWEMPDQPCAGQVLSYRLTAACGSGNATATTFSFTDDGVVVNPPA